MRLHFSSASTLALATAATLAFPFSASAEDYVIRAGQKIAASLEAPVEAATQPSSGPYSKDVAVGETFTNPADNAIKFFTNNGTSTNNGSLYSVQQKAGTFANGASGSIYGFSQTGGSSTNSGTITYTTVEAGTFTNNATGKIEAGVTVLGGSFTNAGQINGGGATVTENGALTNNGSGVIQRLTNNGTVSNAGKIERLRQQAGILTNSATGIIDDLEMSGGTATNSGTIKVTTIQSGSLTNNATGIMTEATLKNGILINNGKIDTATNEANGILTNNKDGVIDQLTNSGTASNAGQLGAVTQSAGELTNNGTILGEAAINGGVLTNNKSIGSATIADGATLVNNKTGVARSVTNSGLVSNNGAIENLEQKAGVLINDANGTISGLTQAAGTTTNNGTITRFIVDGGELTNNKNATMGAGSLNKGTIVNSGSIDALNVSEDGTFTNNLTGVANTVTSAGKGSNDGKIGNLTINDGTFKNTGTITEDATVNGGSLTTTGVITGKLTIDGTPAKQGVVYLSGTVNGGVVNGANGAINMRGNLVGKGNFINNGVMGVNSATTLTGFDTFSNGGTLYVKGGLTVSGDIVSSGKIGMNGDFQGFETVKAGGKLTLTSTAETSINVNSEGDHDTLAAGGNVTLGGTLKVNATGEDYGLKSTFETFTSTAGEIIGDFSNIVVSGVSGLFGAVEETDKGTVLALRNRTLLNEQLADKELGGAEELLADFDYSGKDGAKVFDALAELDEENSSSLMADLTGGATSAIANIGSSAARGFGNLMQKVATASGLRRSNDGVLAYERALAAEQAGKFEPVLRQGQGAVGVWARGFGETGSGDTGGDTSLAGVGAGIEVSTAGGVTLGASGGYSMSAFGKGTTTEGETNSFHGGGYLAIGATAPEATGFGLTVTGSYSKHDTTTKRKIALTDEIATGNYGGTTIAGDVIVRNGFTIGQKVPLTIAPIAGLKFATDTDEAYTETGAGKLNQSVSGAKHNSLIGVVGLQLASRIETESVAFTPYVSAAYQHEFLDTSYTTTRTLAGSDTPFTVTHGGGARSSVALEAGLGMRFAGGLAVDISGYGVISADEKRYGATATLKAGF